MNILLPLFKYFFKGTPAFLTGHTSLKSHFSIYKFGGDLQMLFITTAMYGTLISFGLKGNKHFKIVPSATNLHDVTLIPLNQGSSSRKLYKKNLSRNIVYPRDSLETHRVTWWTSLTQFAPPKAISWYSRWMWGKQMMGTICCLSHSVCLNEGEMTDLTLQIQVRYLMSNGGQPPSPCLSAIPGESNQKYA